MKLPRPILAAILSLLALPLSPARSQSLLPSYDLAKTVGSAADAPHLRAFGATTQAGLGSGSLVADINDDGVDDLIVAAGNANVGSPVRTAAGAVYVWFGGAAFGGEKNLATTPPDLTILGASANDVMTYHGSGGGGKSSMSSGDVNGDGKDDLIIASPLAAGPGESRPYAGEVYVIFGRAGFPATLDMAVQGAGGADVTLYGASSSPSDPYNTADKLGERGALAVADVNGDGIADMVLGAPNADGPGEAFANCGEAYIVFGRAVFPTTLDMAVQGAGGADVTMYGQHRALPHPSHVDLLTEHGKIATGDVNGDGVADIVLGARSEGPDGLRMSSGKYYVVFGRQSPATFPSTITLAATTGDRADVVIYGANENDAFNDEFALKLGDVNGDSVADILMTAPYGDGPGETRSIAGEVYIVFGRTSPAVFPSVIDLAVQGNGGADVTIYGASEQDLLGAELNLHVGDLNADGIGDLILRGGGEEGPMGDRPGAGGAYIIFGRASFPATLDLAVQGAGGASVTIYGTGRFAGGLFNSFIGEALAAGEGISSGDMNGDGVADLVLGAPNAFRDGLGYTGKAYVIFGRQSPAVFPATIDIANPASANVTVIGAGFGIGSRLPVFGDFNNDDVPDLAMCSGGAAYVVFGTLERPDIAVEQPVGTNLAAGTSNAFFGTVAPGSSSVPMVFTVKNTAFAHLHIASVTVTGSNAGDFAVDTTGTAMTVAGGGATTFSVTFNAGSNAPRIATLRITSDDPNESPFDIVLAGNAEPNVRPLIAADRMLGLLETQVSQNHWKFTAEAGTPVQLRLLGMSAPGVKFTLVGPDDFVAFEGISADSDLLILPTTGEYTLIAFTDGNAGNLSYAFRLDQLTVVDLVLSSPATATLHGPRQSHIYRVNHPDTGAFRVTLTNNGVGNRVELFAKRQGIPTRRNFHFLDASGPGANRQILIPRIPGGEVYIVVYADTVGTPGEYTIEASSPSLVVREVAPRLHPAGVEAVVTLRGAGFQTGVTVELLDGGNVVATANVTVESSIRALATFAAGVVGPGVYDIRVTKPDSTTVTEAAAFEIAAGLLPRLETRIVPPGSLGRNAPGTIYIEYANSGNAPMPAPVLVVQSADPDNTDRPIFSLDERFNTRNFWAEKNEHPPLAASEVYILAEGAQPGVLNAGERLIVPVYYSGLLKPYDMADLFTEIELRFWTADDTTPIDWPSRKAALRPPALDAATWDIVFANATGGLGTNADFIQMLSKNARRLGSLGQPVKDVGTLWNFELMQAFGLNVLPVLDSRIDAAVAAPGTAIQVSRRFASGIASRRQTGMFGRGWFSPLETRLTVEGSGDTVRIIGDSGSARVYTRDARHAGEYFSDPEDPARLFLSGGVHTLRAPDGSLTRFNADGRIAFIEDANGNRVTLTHNGVGRPTALAHTSGASITLNYNAAGHVSGISDSAGRSIIYGYTGDYLATVTTDDGKVTTYTYNTAGAPAVLHTLTSVTHGGITRSFTWDANGRPAATFLGVNEEVVTFTYDDAGGVSLTQGGGTTAVFFDHRGGVAKTVDALGNTSAAEFDGNGRLTRFVFPTGESRSLSWDVFGNPTSISDELGATTNFAYDHPLKRLTRLTDAKSNETNYAYDANGNLLATTFADSSVAQLGAYTAAGLPQTRINRRNQSVAYTYTASGQIDRRTLPDGSYADYDYDARGNLVTVTEHPAVGADKITTYLYNHATHGDRLKKVTSPNGSWAEYFYDANGRRQRMTDSTGGETRYEYDSAGRLSKLRDAANALLAEYLYDTAGRMSRVNKGNATYTTYAYDAAGQLLNVTNFAPDDMPSSQFDYTYDSRGRRTAMTSIDGTWTYTYDATGQLLTATFASINFLIPSRWLEYSYDALGNRTSSSVDFIPTAYTTDALNQYTDIGGVAQTHDADGNLTDDGTRTYVYDTLDRLTQVTGPEGVTQYEYDALGNRSATILNGQRTDYLLDVTGIVDVVAEVPAVGATQRLVHGAGIVLRGATGAARYFDFDGIGSTAALTDATGAAVNSYAFEPFGATMLAVEAAPNPFQFIGQFGVQKEASGLHFMRARHSSAASGRFMQPDPIGLAGEDVNLSRYVQNNPVSFLDAHGTKREGLQEWLESVKANREAKEHLADSTGGDGVSPETLNKTIESGKNVQRETNGALLDLADLARKIYTLPTPGKTPAKRIKKIVKRAKDLINDLEDLADVIDPPSSPSSPSPAGPGRPGGNDNPNNPGGIDPNEKLGPGAGAAGWVQSGALAPYRINFENIGPASRDANGNPFPVVATAPVHRVTITDQLDANLDWDTFALTSFGFGDTIIPAGNRSHFNSSVPMTYNGQTFDVEIEAGIDFATGRVLVVFQSVDPATSLPPGVLTGFLPPEDGTGIGKGHVSFTIRAKTLPTGTEIRNVAEIRFDINNVITTDQIDPLNPAAGTDPAKQALITLDSHVPTSSVIALAPAVVPDFAVSWAGTDTGSGIAGYDVYVREDGGAWTLWQDNTAAISATFHGTLGHTYAFYSVARDLAGNVQPTSGIAQTSTSTAPAIEPVLRILPGSTPAHLFIEITARAGQVVTIEESPDLAAWPTLQTLTLTTGTTTVEIQTVAPPPKRFFRARWTPTP